MFVPHIYGSFLHRMHGALRLFRMILDVINPAFNVEDHQWRPSVIDIFLAFFTLIWQDEKVSSYS